MFQSCHYLPVSFYMLMTMMSSPFECNTVLRRDADLAQLFRELSGSHLRMSASHLPPWLVIGKSDNGNFTYRGFQVDVCNYMTKAINATYSFVNVRDEESDKYGQKEAAVNYLLRNEVDVATYGMLLSLDHYNRMDCSIPLVMAPTGLMVPWPEEESRFLSSFRPFQFLVWIFLLVVVIAMAFALVYVPKLYLKFADVEMAVDEQHPSLPSQSSYASFYNSASNAILYLLTTLTNHGDFHLPMRQLSFRVVVASWCLAAFVLVNAYSTTLFAYLMVPKLLPTAKSFDDLAAGYPQNLKVLIEKGSVMANDFLAATSGSHKMIGDSLRNYPETLFTNRQKGLEMMYSGQYAYPAIQQLLYPFVNAANKKAGHCRFTISNKRLPMPDSIPVYTFQKNWRYTKAINKRMQSLWDSGLLGYWMTKYLPNVDQCLIETFYRGRQARQAQLSLIDLSSPFLILLAGCLISILAFAMELAVFKL